MAPGAPLTLNRQSGRIWRKSAALGRQMAAMIGALARIGLKHPDIMHPIDVIGRVLVPARPAIHFFKV
jgi:hypothetical protein